MEAERDAMGADEYHPISGEGTNLTEAGGIGYTVVDSIDTMLIMGLHDEYARARDWVANKMSFDRDADFNTFEVSVYVMPQPMSRGSRPADDYSCPRRAAVCIYPY